MPLNIKKKSITNIEETNKTEKNENKHTSPTRPHTTTAATKTPVEEQIKKRITKKRASACGQEPLGSFA